MSVCECMSEYAPAQANAMTGSKTYRLCHALYALCQGSRSMFCHCNVWGSVFEASNKAPGLYRCHSLAAGQQGQKGAENAILAGQGEKSK